LNSETKGILLYGTNACGKSTLMKALGLSLIMAQCGMFVPANKMRFSPYENFFTRILGNDNIYRGLSSFAVEMTELRSILKRMNKKSLILGDEVCNGTESISALAIVSSTIMKMTEKQSNYIFATHLHELNAIEELNEIKTMKRFHLKIRQENDLLIYDRKLEEGSGDAIYGLKVARAMDMDETFLTNANKILLKLTQGKIDIVEHNPSHYNARKNVALCEVCGDKAVDTHHIQEQNEADINGMIGAIHKNRKSNLTALCKKCHLEEHHGNLNIKGYIETSEGKKLDYEYITPKEKKKGKYTDHQIVLIKNIRHQEPSMSLKYGVQELKKLDIDISVATLRKYWKD
jgi:DNA mismatch repair protein MutS